MLRKLSFGCGSVQKEGWYNLDQEDFGQQFIGSSDLFPDEHFDIIVAHCSLQMNEWHSINNALKDLHRIIKTGGVLRISLPDMLRGFRAYQENDLDWFPNSGIDVDEKLSGWVNWFSTSKTLLTPNELARRLFGAGFIKVMKMPFWKSVLGPNEITELDSRENECFIIESIK